VSDQFPLFKSQLLPAPEKYPGGSRERVSKAGDAVRNNSASADDFAVIERWRAAHRHVLNSFQALLRNRTRGQKIVVAQRHKRKSTIFGKLTRIPGMRLHRMDDVAGCRLIFPDIESLYNFREALHKANFRHELHNEEDKYDYIKAPKPDGYRGIHDVYKYDAKSHHGAAYKGLQIELQYRTVFQHAWATCVEVLGFVTKSNPKFKTGDPRYETIMAYASEMIARIHEDRFGPLPQKTAGQLLSEFSELDNSLNFLGMLRTLETSNPNVRGNRSNIILIFSDSEPLDIRTYKDASEAIYSLFELEMENQGNQKDIVLVRGSRTDIRNAFRNYFTDATDFVAYIDQAIEGLKSIQAEQAQA